MLKFLAGAMFATLIIQFAGDGKVSAAGQTIYNKTVAAIQYVTTYEVQ